jgi:2-polyprenyl-3-methyl-5-hydroxy-6-metoxy-1,4-benzoquinol methylase
MDYQSFYSTIQKDKREEGGYYPEKIKYILSSIGTCKRVLDVGCNDGYISGLILQNYNEVYGVDIVKNNIVVAKKRGVKAIFFDITKSKFPYQRNYFDVILLGDVIEHVFDTDMLLKNCYDILKPDGFVLLTTPNVASFGRRLMLLFGISPYLEYSPNQPTNDLPSVGHIRYYTRDTLFRQLTMNKYKAIEIIGDKINFGIASSSMIAYYIPQLAVNLMCKAYK